MKHALAAFRAAPASGLLATAALHALAAEATRGANDLGTGQPQAIAVDSKKLGAVCVRVPDGSTIDDGSALKLLVGSTMNGKTLDMEGAKVLLARTKHARHGSAGPVCNKRSVVDTGHRRREVALN